MSLLKGIFVENDTLDGSKIKLKNNEYIRARNADDTGDVDLIKVNPGNIIEFASAPRIGASELVDASKLGAANGIATLDENGLVPSAQLPSYVDDVLEFDDLASFPLEGESGKIYIAIDTNKTYRWSGTLYAEITSGSVNSVNGQVGVVVLDTDDISEGAANFYYTQGRFDTSFGAKSTSDLSEGMTNLYFTDARVLATALNSFQVGANESLGDADTIIDAFGKIQGQINALSTASANAEVESITITATDIINGYVSLSNTPTKVLSVSPVGGLVQEPGADYIVTTNQVAWAGDLASVIDEGDKLIISYVY